jgi:2-dehydro-3-deoxyglucarate aldolase/4-hydroxy-2-oxoheptanedioate aldolase
MHPNSVKQRLARGEVVLGTFALEFSSTGLPRLMAEAGAEFAVFDMEHTAWSMETIRSLMAVTPRARMVPVVRVPATEYHFLSRVLDAGALGIMVPMVESKAQAERIVQSCKYPPQGRRGAAFTVAHDDYTAGDVAAKIASANAETLLIAQIETAAGLEQVGQIAAVPAIDVLWIGHFDLTNSLGIPGQFAHPEFQRAIERVVAATNQHGKAAGYLVSDVREAQLRLDQGFRCLAYQADLWLYQNALREGLEKVRAAVRAG